MESLSHMPGMDLGRSNNLNDLSFNFFVKFGCGDSSSNDEVKGLVIVDTSMTSDTELMVQ